MDNVRLVYHVVFVVITDVDSLGISVAVPFKIPDNVVPVIVFKNIVGMLSVPVLLE